jgi:hypothetical protein
MNVLLAVADDDLPRWESAVRQAGHAVALGGAASIAPTDLGFAILGGSAAAVLQSARTVGKQLPLLVVPRAASAAAIAYGLLPDAEDGRRLRPAWVDRHAAAVREFLTRFARGEFGDLSLIRWERTEPAPTAAPGRLAVSVIDERFFEDVDLLRLLGGDYQRITAVPLALDGTHARQFSVTLGGDGLAESIWTIIPGGESRWTLTITGTRGAAVLQWSAGGPVTLSINGITRELPTQCDEVACVSSFAESPSPSSDQTAGHNAEAVPASEWNDLVRAANLLEGLHRSIRRRRTIDLHFESTSERSQFKTQMTAVGCGVLTWAFFGTCLGLILGSTLDPRDSSERRAAAADTILYEADFLDHGAVLQIESRARLVRQAQVDGPEAIVLIAQQSAAGLNGIDSERLSAVESLLGESATTRRAQITVQPLSGTWFRRLMLIIWIITFAPLAIFLAFQVLITITRTSDRSDLG